MKKENSNESESEISVLSTLKENLYCYLTSNSISLRDFADKSGLPFTTLNNLYYGHCADCKLSTAMAIAKAMNVTVDELVDADTLENITKLNIKRCRELSPNARHLVRWFINHQCVLTEQSKNGEKFISVLMLQPMPNLTLKVTNNFRQIDINKIDLDKTDLRRSDIDKIFFAMKLNCDCYFPLYNEDDIILIANDRQPNRHEHVVITINDTLFIAECIYDSDRKMNFYSIRDGKYRCSENDISELIGYIICVVTDTSECGNR